MQVWVTPERIIGKCRIAEILHTAAQLSTTEDPTHKRRQKSFWAFNSERFHLILFSRIKLLIERISGVVLILQVSFCIKSHSDVQRWHTTSWQTISNKHREKFYFRSYERISRRRMENDYGEEKRLDRKFCDDWLLNEFAV